MSATVAALRGLRRTFPVIFSTSSSFHVTARSAGDDTANRPSFRKLSMNATKYKPIGKPPSRASCVIALNCSRSVSITRPTSPLPGSRRSPGRHLRRKRRLSERISWRRKQPILCWGKRRAKPLSCGEKVLERLREKPLTEYQPT
jgi:hypothetical protein